MTWTEVPGSKIDLVRDSLRWPMAQDIACVRRQRPAYLGVVAMCWRLPTSGGARRRRGLGFW